MKKLVYLLLSIPVFVLGQSTDQNWVKVKTYKQPTSTPITTPTIEQATTQVNYYDGLGRPIQQVAHGQSNTGKDIVTHIEYDAFGRQIKEFLPYVNQSASLNYNSSANNDVLNFYNSSNYENTANPFSEKLLEASPLDKVLKQAAPGNPWALGSGKEIKFDYQTNTSNEVKFYKVTLTWNASHNIYNIALNEIGYYAPNELYKTITYDENSPGGTSKLGRTEEFKDKEGKVVLKRTFNNNDPHESYYVYDVYGNLTYVIPPAVDTNDHIDQTKLDNMCYQYKYDQRNRLIEKKLPGKQWEYIVYDKLDRVVATGPAYNPWGGGDSKKGWMITKYDVFNRPVYTGWYSGAVASSADRNTMQNNYSSSTVLSESKATSNVTLDAVAIKYTNTVFPTNLKLLTVNYYDNYDYPNAPSIPAQIEGQTTTTTGLKGLATGSWVRVLDNASSTTNELSYTLYDTRLRPIRVYTKNYLGGYTQVNTKLDWAGKTEYTVTEHKRTTSGLGVIVKDIFEYTAQDRLLKHTQEINSSSGQLISSNSYDELGQLVSKKVGGEDITASTSLQKVDYKYNIRGWLKEINDATNLTPSANEEDLFAFKINYNQLEQGSTGQALFNGNIAETLWRSYSDDIKRKYEYNYDHLNRLLQANYSKPDASTNINNYKEWLSYDKNGNIADIIRTGNVDLVSGNVENIIDELHFTYDTNNKNLLLKVDDTSNSPQGFKDNYNSSGDDYTYDANGNMISDNNKEIRTIVYNHLNLPTEIIFSGTTNGTIYYLYNAVGQKINKLVEDEFQNETLTDYLSGFHYENGVLQFFPHAEGYVKVTGNVGRNGQIQFYFFNYVFNYTDHLGNIRLSYAQDPSNINVLKILEENHYYPFGLKHKNYNVDQLNFEEFPETGVEIVPTDNPMYKYKYQGQERQDDLGLNWDSFKWRNYDYAIGRFMSIDPLAMDYTYNSPYAFQENKMGMGRELEGLELAPFEIFIEESVIIEPFYYEPNLQPLPFEPVIEIPTAFEYEVEPVLIDCYLDPSIIEKNRIKDNSNEATSGQEVNSEKHIDNSSQNSKTGQGRGSNNRTPDDEAVGDHTVRDSKGHTTYKENPNNPNKNSKGKGFETEKRVDYEGASHKNKNGENVPTPHVHEGKNVRPAIPGKDMPKKNN
ncbi:Probable Rhs family protein precursor [Flavobacterium indicum GPTSA100-9 = DSM 17447]|uniref:Probable Rhs family protein n=1 Tax=Flavobacterium indicum (strain DSM 17447 / CIP 109464 / GPTSA100-9) TaxID=1094466 RepID=H8XNR3_FLAIG|nr:DUF6443 domain-containing protein [Flavobacterium indicum]CCG52180.1 Probable Rhs family protein precursor [Flavobacterium indicum GPTSA100-9 = DSM 17447]